MNDRVNIFFEGQKLNVDGVYYYHHSGNNYRCKYYNKGCRGSVTVIKGDSGEDVFQINCSCNYECHLYSIKEHKKAMAIIEEYSKTRDKISQAEIVELLRHLKEIRNINYYKRKASSLISKRLNANDKKSNTFNGKDVLVPLKDYIEEIEDIEEFTIRFGEEKPIEEEEYLIYVDKKNMNLVKDSPYIFVDGMFSKVPEPFSQLYTFHILNGPYPLPVIFCDILIIDDTVGVKKTRLSSRSNCL